MLKLNQLNFIQNIEKNLALGFQISSKYPDFCIKKLPWVNLSLKLKIEISEFSWVIISHSEFFFSFENILNYLGVLQPWHEPHSIKKSLPGVEVNIKLL